PRRARRARRPVARRRRGGHPRHSRRSADRLARRPGRPGVRRSGGGMTRQVPVAAVSLVGLALFCWPFLGTGLPDNTPAWTLTLACLAALFAAEARARPLAL